MFKKIFETFSRTEWLIFGVALFVFAASFIFSASEIFRENTISAPIAGGEYFEGMIGQPTFINPVLGEAGEADRTLSRLIFDDILSLAESRKISDDGKVFNIRLKEDAKWHDGDPITSDDVIFSIRAIQNPDSRSALFSAWRGVEAQRISEREIKLTLSSPYAFFENTLQNLRPIPKHIFGVVPAANLRLSNYNLEPIGNGPFRFEFFEKKRDGFIVEYRLVRNENYFGEKPYLGKFTFRFFPDEKELADAFNAGALDGAWGLAYRDLEKIKISHRLFKLKMPRYYAVFFNPFAREDLKSGNVRRALAAAVDRTAIVEKVFGGNAAPVYGPFSNFFESGAVEEDGVGAADSLEKDGWRLNAEGIREKKAKKDFLKLEFNLAIPQAPFLLEAAELIKEEWAKIGVKANLLAMPPQEINEAIKTRNYEMIFFGNILGESPDIYSFWHSAERFYPGLNLALYENRAVDALIESVRRNLNPAERERGLKTLQSLIAGDAPAAFLFSPDYFYVVKNKPAVEIPEAVSFSDERLENVNKWHLKTAKVFK